MLHRNDQPSPRQARQRANNLRDAWVIGMDVLRKCREQINFDAGWIRFLDSLPPNPVRRGTRELALDVVLEVLKED